MLLPCRNRILPKISLHKKALSNTKVLIPKEDLPAPAYKAEIVERRKYLTWEENGLFKGDNCSSKPTFSMVLPPPNVTGTLHLGHALACTVQDVIVRRKRSLGYNVLWLPGIDHAGIATQTIVEKYLKNKYNKHRNDIGRHKFNSEVWKWKDKHGDAIQQQLKSLGCSLDWSRQVFTMDPKHTSAVNTAFLKLFNKGLIYRKKTLVNWCNTLKSTVSDIEIEDRIINEPTDIILSNYNKPIKFGVIYDFAYKVVDSHEEIIVSTTMPETMLGDTAVAVNPYDTRYTHLKGKRVVHPFRQVTIPIIFDDFVDIKFGTGAVKLTPAHNKVDYEVAKRHNLPMLQVFDEDGLIINSKNFEGLNRYECRDIVVQKLIDLELFKKTSPHKMTLPTCARTGDVIEYIPKEQWFLSCSKLNIEAAKLVENGHIKIEPVKFVKDWLKWTGDNRDWCVSRQLWWGHQIPAYECRAGDDILWVAAHNENSAKIIASKLLRCMPDIVETIRDTDVLDTWFSSALYPFASMGWPEEHNDDFRKFYPLSLMVTGHDILGFWVHRMIMLGLELTSKLPFENILLHGIICDKKGAKMSKSKGNVIDPTDVIRGISIDALRKKSEGLHENGVLSTDEMTKAIVYQRSNFSKNNGIPECGVDALRFTLLSHDIKSHFINFDVELCHANTLFCNKIWQSVNYVKLCHEKLEFTDSEVTINNLTNIDKWILSRLANTVCKVNQYMDTYDFHLATKAIKTLIHNEFCDVYLEATKPHFVGDDPNKKYAHAHTLSAVLNTSLRCLAPFMIYLTDELIPKVPDFKYNIIYNFEDSMKKYFDFPKSEQFKVWYNKKLETEVDKVLNLINIIRHLRGLYGITSKIKSNVWIETKEDTLKSIIKDYQPIVLHLTRCENIGLLENTTKTHIHQQVDENTKINLELIGEDIESVMLQAKTKLEKRILKIEKSLSKLEAKFSNDRYVNSMSESIKMQDQKLFENMKEELMQLQSIYKLT